MLVLQRNVLEVQGRLKIPEFVYWIPRQNLGRATDCLIIFSITFLNLHVNAILIQQRILPHSYFLTIHDNFPIISDT